MLSHLQEKHDAIIALYEAYRGSVLELQATLRDEVLPELVDELEVDDRCSQWGKNWVDDHGSLFRMLKKHAFDIAEASAALERTLKWRISELASLQDDLVRDSGPFIRCLPGAAHDLLGRPVMLLQLAKLSNASDAVKHEIVFAHEEMRQHLCSSSCDLVPSLQCIMIVDFKDVAVRSMAVELIPWFIREVSPRFPGMCAAVFVVNYSWAYGMYNFVKRLLPSNVLARIYFPSESDLLSCFEKECLPRDYGGDLDMTPSPNPPSPTCNLLAGPSIPIMDEGRPSGRPPPDVNLARFLPSMSRLNPYFGYPAFSNPGSSVPYLKNGRRRKRDLVRTLALLWLTKLKRLADKTWLWIIMTLVLWAFGLRR